MRRGIRLSVTYRMVTELQAGEILDGRFEIAEPHVEEIILHALARDDERYQSAAAVRLALAPDWFR
jgi:hypothetical protein